MQCIYNIIISFTLSKKQKKEKKMKTIPAVKTRQNGKDILLFSLSAKSLREISYFNPNSKVDEGKEALYRSKAIAKYIDSEDAFLANNIIINFDLNRLSLTLDNVFCNNQLDLQKMLEIANNTEPAHPSLKGKVAFVIDGQHRLKAFDYTHKDMPLVVTAFINLTLAEVAEIFVNINYHQKPVNKSVVFDVLGISEDIFPQYFKLHKIVEKLHLDDIESPFYGKIKMLGIGKGFISQASLVTAIEKSGIEETIKKLQLSGEESDQEDVLYDVIWNFFKAVQEEFKDQWERKDSFLAKPVTIRALFLLMKDALKKIISEDKVFSVEEIRKYLRRINKELSLLGTSLEETTTT